MNMLEGIATAVCTYAVVKVASEEGFNYVAYQDIMHDYKHKKDSISVDQLIKSKKQKYKNLAHPIYYTKGFIKAENTIQQYENKK